MTSDPDILIDYVNQHFQGYPVECCYEASCCGFFPYRQLSQAGWHVKVLNPSDIPQSAKNKDQKSDRLDCRHLAKQLHSQLLRDHIEAVTPLSDNEFDYILSHFKPKKLKKHTYLIQEDEYVKYEYFVLKGCLKAFVADSHTGKEFIYQFGTEDWRITDREAFFQGSKATVNISCLEDCEFLGITLSDRKKLGESLWKYEHFMQVKANLGYISLQKRLQSMIMGNAKDRYEQFTKQYPHLTNRIPKTYIASYFGISRETLSRLYLS